MPPTYIELQNVSKTYQSKDGLVAAVNDVSFAIGEAEFIAIVGPSGCGKTTILKMIAGLVPYSSGTITINGQRIHGPHTDLGIVFQDAVLLDWRDVLENVLLQIDIRRLARATYEPLARELLTRTGLAGFERKYPFELSGGMKQ
ncbi:MAG: ATP-binding cassette domain-containing protein, partial [Caldilineaceae bacterium]|nr:ATP-binding cassette domain-containing protein [Caldilineaceae bacterium]